MKHVNEIATIQSVELSEQLIGWNEDNDAFRVRLRFAYQSTTAKEDEEEGILSLSDFEDAGASVGKVYTCLINFDSLLTDKHNESAQEKALKTIKDKFEGKKARFSTFDYTISELTEGKEKVVNNGKRDYSSLSNSYLGNVEDEENELNKLKTRLNQYIENDDFSFGSVSDE